MIECSPTRDADVFSAACTAMGTLGIVTQLRMQNRAPYALREHVYTAPLADVLRDLEQLDRGAPALRVLGLLRGATTCS